MKENNNFKTPLGEQYTLTIRQAAEYFNIGEKKLRKLVDEKFKDRIEI